MMSAYLLVLMMCLGALAQDVKPLNVIFPNDELYPKKTLAEWKSLMVNASDMPSSQGQSLTTVESSRGFNTRIVGGSASLSAKQFPWQTAIKIENRYFCGGTLISASWVLTAARCLVDYTVWEVRVGSINPFRGGQSFITKNKIVHSKFTRNPVANDIGLLRVNFKVNEYVNPIRLPGVNFQPLIGKTARASGWGQIKRNSSVSSSLQWVDLNILDNMECLAFYGHFTKNQICVSGMVNRSICLNDIGGPLSIQDKHGIWYQVGVASFVSGNGCMLNYPSGYTRISSYRNWISVNTGISI